MRESVVICAPTARIWAMIADPETWPGWNDKVQWVKRSRTGPILPNESFEASFKLGSKETQTQIEVLKLIPPTSASFRQHLPLRQRPRFVEVHFQLLNTAQGVQVSQVIDLSHAGIPWPLRWLLHWIQRFGKPQGSSPLEELKVLLESSTSPANPPPA